MIENYETIIRDHVLAEKRLRDAAPDLLAALERITSEYVQARYYDTCMTLPQCEELDEVAQARAAIAKAKGEA